MQPKDTHSVATSMRRLGCSLIVLGVALPPLGLALLVLWNLLSQWL